MGLVARARFSEETPSTLSALRRDTLVEVLTASGALPAGARRLRAVPFVLVSVVVVDAELDRPRMNFPPVAATAVPLPSTSMHRAPAVNEVSLEERMLPPVVRRTRVARTAQP